MLQLLQTTDTIDVDAHLTLYVLVYKTCTLLLTALILWLRATCQWVGRRNHHEQSCCTHGRNHMPIRQVWPQHRRSVTSKSAGAYYTCELQFYPKNEGHSRPAYYMQVHETPGMGSSRTVLDLEDSSRTKMCGLGLGLEAHWPWPWPWPWGLVVLALTAKPF